MASPVIESVDEAAKKTRELLLPFDIHVWGKLAIIILLTGGVGFGLPGMPGSSGGTGGYDNYDPGTATQVPTESFADTSAVTGAFSASSIVYAALAFAVGIGLVALLVSSIFEFVYYRSLIDADVKIRENFSDNINRGARYFNFRLIYSIGILLTLLAAAITVINYPLAAIPAVIALLPAIALLYAFNTLIHDFVLLKMLEDEMEFLESLKAVFGYFRDDLRTAALYLAVKFGISILVASAVGIVSFLVLLVIAIPMIFIGVIAYMISQLLLIPIILVGIVLAIVVSLFVTVPLKTFVYYYAITVFEELSI